MMSAEHDFKDDLLQMVKEGKLTEDVAVDVFWSYLMNFGFLETHTGTDDWDASRILVRGWMFEGRQL